MPTWIGRLRFVTVSAGSCRIERLPVVVVESNGTTWWLWWVPLVHVGGKPYTSFSVSIQIDPVALRAEVTKDAEGTDFTRRNGVVETNGEDRGLAPRAARRRVSGKPRDANTRSRQWCSRHAVYRSYACRPLAGPEPGSL